MGITQQRLKGISYFVYQRAEEPKHMAVSIAITLPGHAGASASAGVLFCYQDPDDHYVLRVIARGEPDNREVVLERRRGGAVERLRGKMLSAESAGSVRLELITYLEESERWFVVFEEQEIAQRSRVSRGHHGQFKEIFRVRETRPLENGRFGLYAQDCQGVHFSQMVVQKLKLRKAGFKKITSSSLQAGFDIHAPASILYGERLIAHDESTSLFKGMEFKKFDHEDLGRIPVGRLGHGVSGQASLFLGAYLKVFAGQRIRFFGRLFAGGSFALVSEAEVRPLNLSVLGIPVALPFEGYSRLTLAGRQKRNGYYGFVEASGYFDWLVVPGVLRLEAGSKSKPALLKLYSTGQFEIHAEATAILFDGAAVVNGTVDVSHEHCFVRGSLVYALPNVLRLDIEGSGRIGPGESYAFEGKGDIELLGHHLPDVDVMLSQQWAQFSTHLALNPGDWSLNLPILDSCTLDMDLDGRVNLRRTTRPEYRFEGRGMIAAFGAAITGRGGIRSVVATQAANDFFEAYMEGTLEWQGRKWVGGSLTIGSNGLSIKGATSFGIKLTPESVPGTTVNIAHLFLSVNLEGTFKIRSTGSLHFNFQGFWTLGVALAGSTNGQLLPVASQRFVFSSGGDGNAEAYELQLFKIQELSFSPTPSLEIPTPTVAVAVKNDAVAFLRMGQQKVPGAEVPAVEFRTGFGRVGLRGLVPYWDSESDWSDVKVFYKVADHAFSLDTDTLTLGFHQLDDVTLSIAIKNDAAAKFPMVLRVKSPAGTKEYSP
jgi:hypothetical protein